MKRLGVKEIQLKKLQLPGNIRALMDEPRIEARADSIHKLDLLEPIKVRKSDMRLIAGRDRVAAHMKLGLSTILAELLECTDEEAQEIDLHTNVERRHDADEQRRLIQARVNQVVETLKREQPDLPVERAGRHRTVKREALERVAGELGMNRDAVRKRVERAEQAEARGDRPKPPKPEPANDVEWETFGVPLPPEQIQVMDRVDRQAKEAAALVTRALSILAGLTKFPHHELLLTEVRKQLQTASAAVRGLAVSTVCPYCKAQEEFQGACTACLGSGYLHRVQNKNVPAELLDGTRVMKQGKLVKLPVPKRRVSW